MKWLVFPRWTEHRLYVDQDHANADKYVARVEKWSDGLWHGFVKDGRPDGVVLPVGYKSWPEARKAVACTVRYLGANEP